MQEFIEQGKVPIKAWTDGVELDHKALNQVRNTASLPIVGPHVALMPDCHYGMGSTVGSVIPTRGAVIPAAVGVDIGCGMMAERLGLSASDLPVSLDPLYVALEAAIPHGGPGTKGSWNEHGYHQPRSVADQFLKVDMILYEITQAAHGRLNKAGTHALGQFGTLGTGNHFIELCLDEANQVWIMLHSGSRGIGNAIGTYYIERAQTEMRDRGVSLPDRDLAWLPDDTQAFREYIQAMRWAQEYARGNRTAMMMLAKSVVYDTLNWPEKWVDEGREIVIPYEAVNCHHNFTQLETHFGEEVWLTRKGAVSAKKGELGIIPGSMGVKSYIVRGLGNPASFQSCSHGAGRTMSRGQAKRSISVERHVEATQGVTCRKDAGMLDESPDAYKDIEAVMAAQADLVEIVHTLKGVLCLKG